MGLTNQVTEGEAKCKNRISRWAIRTSVGTLGRLFAERNVVIWFPSNHNGWGGILHLLFGYPCSILTDTYRPRNLRDFLLPRFQHSCSNRSFSAYGAEYDGAWFSGLEEMEASQNLIWKDYVITLFTSGYHVPNLRILFAYSIGKCLRKYLSSFLGTVTFQGKQRQILSTGVNQGLYCVWSSFNEDLRTWSDSLQLNTWITYVGACIRNLTLSPSTVPFSPVILIAPVPGEVCCYPLSFTRTLLLEKMEQFRTKTPSILEESVIPFLGYGNQYTHD